MTFPCDHKHKQGGTNTNYYKLLMADMSQVCDGRKLMQFDHEKSVRVRPTSKRSDDGQVIQALNRLSFDNKIPLCRGYRPVIAKNTRRASLKNQTSQGNKVNKPTCDNETLSSTDSSSSSDNSFSTGSYDLTPEPRKRRSYPKTASSQDDDGRPRSMLRQKYRPRHHNTLLNQSLSSIMKPSRYSNKDTPHRRASLPTSSRRYGFDSFCRFTSDVSIGSNDSWVPLGVNFSANMEVYVYKN